MNASIVTFSSFKFNVKCEVTYRVFLQFSEGAHIGLHAKGKHVSFAHATSRQTDKKYTTHIKKETVAEHKPFDRSRK